MSELWAGFPNFGQGGRTLGSVSDLRAGCPNFGQGVLTLGRVSELWVVCPILGHTTLMDELLITSVHCSCLPKPILDLDLDLLLFRVKLTSANLVQNSKEGLIILYWQL